MIIAVTFHTPWNSIIEYLSGFRIALLFLQKTCDKICNRKLSIFSGLKMSLLSIFSGFRMSLLLKQKTCDKGCMSSGLKVIFASHKMVQTILIRCMSRFHCYLTWKSWEDTPRKGGRHQAHQTLKKFKKYKGDKKHHTMVMQSIPKMPKWDDSTLKAWSILAWILGFGVDRMELMAFQVAIPTSMVTSQACWRIFLEEYWLSKCFQHLSVQRK